MRKYDSVDRLLSEKTNSNEIVCKYDDIGGVVEKTWPGGRTEKYSHDLNGVLTKIEETVGGSLGSGVDLIAALKPSGSNYLGEASYQGGINLTYGYDERKRLVELNMNSPAGMDEKIKYRYDVANRKRVEAFLGQDPKISYFEFDNKHRIFSSKDGFNASRYRCFFQVDHDQAIDAIKSASSAATHSEEFDYVASDSRIKYTQTGSVIKNYTYVQGHRIQSDGTNSYSYFKEGTLQSNGKFTLEADALGRVVSIKIGNSDICNISYDALGRPGTSWKWASQ